MSQKRKRSRSSNSRHGAKRFRDSRENYDSYHGSGRSRRYNPNEKRDYKTSRYYIKNNYRNCSRNSRNRRRSSSGGKRKNRIYYENKNESNRRNYEKKYHERKSSKRRYRSQSSSRSSFYSSSSRSSSGDSRSRSSSSNSTCTEVQRSTSVPNDKNGHLLCKPGDKILNRYMVQSVLGEGTFGRVIECVDLCKGNVRVAMKVVRNVRRYREAAKMEVNVLNTLNHSDPTGNSHCIRMLDWFLFHGHLCITFAKFGDSVFEFLKKNAFQSFSIQQVCQIAYQLCKSVFFMHKNKLTHTDLKPENILFRDSTADTLYTAKSSKPLYKVRCASIELIDFGSATFDHEHHSSVVSTRHYRAPEVVLELGWSQPCDVWSIGCIVFELYTGNTLFQTHDNREHMAMMQKILGPLPSHMIRKTKRDKYFYKGKLDWDEESTSGKYVMEHCKSLKDYIKGDSAEEKFLFELLARMLDYNDSHRITLSSALKHPFFRNIDKSNGCYKEDAFRGSTFEGRQLNSFSSRIKTIKTNGFKSNDSNSIYRESIEGDYKASFDGCSDTFCNGGLTKKRRKSRYKAMLKKSIIDDCYNNNHYQRIKLYNENSTEYNENAYKLSNNSNVSSSNIPIIDSYQDNYVCCNQALWNDLNGYNSGYDAYNERNVDYKGETSTSYDFQSQYNPSFNSNWNTYNSNHSVHYSNNESNCTNSNNKSDDSYKYAQNHYPEKDYNR